MSVCWNALPGLLLFISMCSACISGWIWLCQHKLRLDGAGSLWHCVKRALQDCEVQSILHVCMFIYRVCLHIYSFVCIASEIASEKKRTRPGKWKKKKSKCAFEPVLFLCDLVAVDALNESVCWCLCMLALYSYCKTSRLIFQSACQCTCAVMHAVDSLL